MRVWILFPVALALSACEPPAESIAPLYDSAVVEPGDIEISVEASGVVEPEKTVEVKSKASGEILAVHAETGDIVEAGTLLVEVEKRTPSNRLAEVEASLLAAKARRTIAETQMKRSATLVESGTLTQADFEQTQLEFANAEAQVVAAEVAVENARIAMDDTDVRAPITGTIIAKSVEPGVVITSPTNAVSGGTVLMQMADLTAVQVRTRVDETDIGKIHPGMPAKVIVAAYPNQPFEGTVLKIEPLAIVDQNVTTFAVLIRLENRDGLLMPGMNADVEIEIASRQGVLTVPTAALRADSDIPTTALMLGIEEGQLRALLQGEGARAAPIKDYLEIGGQRVELPEGTDAAQVQALIDKRRGGGTLTEDERALLQPVFEQVFAGGNGGQRGAGGFPGGGGPPGGFQPGGGTPGGFQPGGGPPGGSQPGGGPPGGFSPGGSPPGGFSGGFIVQGASPQPENRPSTLQYQFGGDYWVIAIRDGQIMPVRVKTGITDLANSEIVTGLAAGDEVLLLPSASLFDQQARLQEFISSRFSSTPFQQQQQQGNWRPF
jgi:HlyD family secretion protein